MENHTANVQKSAHHSSPPAQNFEQFPTSKYAAQASGEARSAGLVSFSTSDTRTEGDSQTILIDRKAGRLRRMKSGVMTAARLIHEEIARTKVRWQPWMITPTYRPGEVWKPAHMTSLVKCLRSWAHRRGFALRYVWVAEMQQGRYRRSGSVPGECVHYHMLVWVPARFSCPKPDKQGWWAYGSTRREKVRRPLRYILKYASKGDEVEFPKGLRIHGCGGLSEQHRSERAWWLMPRWVRALWSADQRPRRASGGGFVIQSTGAWYPSIWEVWTARGSVLCTLRDGLFDFFSLSQLARVFCEEF